MSEHEGTKETEEKDGPSVWIGSIELHKAKAGSNKTQQKSQDRENFRWGLTRPEFFSLLPQIVIAAATIVNVIVLFSSGRR